jgi:hypothetical protein
VGDLEHGLADRSVDGDLRLPVLVDERDTHTAAEQ